jgi:tetratricopeptide (TPR) repeat protein
MKGDLDGAVALIEAGKKLFPNVRQLMLSEILVNAGENESRASELLVEYSGTFPDDPEIAVIAAGTFPSDANRLRLESVLWNSFLENPEDSRTASYLAAGLMASSDEDGLARLLDVWERENGDTAWSFFMRGYQALLNNQSSVARESFEASYARSKRWETAFNLGVIAQRAGEISPALEHFREAESSIDLNSPNAADTKAFIRAATSRALYERGDYDGALREAKYALDLDPGSNEASLIVDLLEYRAN